MKKSFILLFACFQLVGCSAVYKYRFENPNTCIDAKGNKSAEGGSCTEEHARKNRAVFFKQCKDLNGTPSIYEIGEGTPVKSIIGIKCLMPDGNVRDLYNEKMEKDLAN